MRHRTVLTTGANSGVGLATVLELAARGHRSVGTVRSEAKAEAVAHAAAERGVSVETLLLDVTDAHGCAEVIEAVRPDALVNNAGYAFNGPLEDTPAAVVAEQLEINLVGLHRVVRAVLPIMRGQGRGRIINVSSMVGRVGLPFMGAYVASKFAIEGYSESLRAELAPLYEHICRFELNNGEVTYSMFENISIGSHAPYGFDSFEAVAE